MGRDLTAALKASLEKQGVKPYESDVQNLQNNNNKDNNASHQSPVESSSVSIQMERLDHDLSDFFSSVEELTRLINEFKASADSVKIKWSHILSNPIPDERQKQELDDIMDSIKRQTTLIRNKLKEMDKENLSEVDNNTETDFVPANIRIRKSQHDALLRTFVQIMNDYQFAQTEYRDRCKNRIRRQLEITNSNLSEDEVENMIEQGNWSVFTQGIIMETEQAKRMLADVEARHKDIIALEKSLRELHDLFLEMANLVELQGESVDRIENHVTGTKDYIAKATEEIRKAEVYQTQSRKKKFYILGLVLIIIIILVLIIYFSI